MHRTFQSLILFLILTWYSVLAECLLRGCEDGPNENGPIDTVTIVAVSIAGVFFVVLFCCRCSAHKKQQAFADAVEEAKQDVASNNTTLSAEATPHSGEYTSTYTERGETRNGTINLVFTQESGGFRISGNGNGSDVDRIIKEGHVNYNGQAWWREVEVIVAGGSGHRDDGGGGMQILSTGTFDFVKRTFGGRWQSSRGESGTYTSFAATEAAPPEQAPVVSVEPSSLDTIKL